MKMMYLLFIFGVVFIRLFAGYDSRFQKGKYIVIRNRKLRMLFIDEMSFFARSKRPKKDIDKMTVSGLALYIFSLTVLVLNIVLLCFVPKIPAAPWGIETARFVLYTDTLNEKFSAIAIWLLFLAVIWCLAVSLLRCAKMLKQKWIKVIAYTASFVIFAAVALIAFDMIKELIMCFI